MKLGRATAAAISGAPTAQGDLVPQWVSLFGGSYSPTAIRPSAGRPVLYVESGLDAQGYRRLIKGDYDDRLHELRERLPFGSIPRWDHEMDGPPNEWRTWGSMDPPLYVEGFQKAASILGPLAWAATSVWKRWEPYWPGDDAVSHVGFDYYDKGKLKPLDIALVRPMAECRRLSRRPILITEVGSLRRRMVNGTWVVIRSGRARWLRSLGRVKGLWGAIYFDIDMGKLLRDPRQPDWTWTPAMRRAWEGL